jgi:hypothetical protein
MNDTTRVEARPDITDFVNRVRARLSDLSEEEREELVGGLEADLAELVADGGSVSELGDPRAYADELRSAAGVPARSRDASHEPARPLGDVLAAGLDHARNRWEALVNREATVGAWSFLVTLRPVWWVFRAWLAVQLVDIFASVVNYRWSGDQPTVVPTLLGPFPGVVVLAVAVVGSVQIGRGRWWPGSAIGRSVAARVLLVGLNAFAVVATPVVLGQFANAADAGYGGAASAYPTQEPQAGLRNAGEYVQNVFPYDAQGRPLTGVQLFDQDGNPLVVPRFAGETVAPGGERLISAYPWLQGERQVYNVFPLPRREQELTPTVDTRVDPDAWTSANPPYLPGHPLTVVPPVALPAAPADAEARGEAAGTGDEADGTDSEKPSSR